MIVIQQKTSATAKMVVNDTTQENPLSEMSVKQFSPALVWISNVAGNGSIVVTILGYQPRPRNVKLPSTVSVDDIEIENDLQDSLPAGQG